jgi:hypothetical protein
MKLIPTLIVCAAALFASSCLNFRSAPVDADVATTRDDGGSGAGSPAAPDAPLSPPRGSENSDAGDPVSDPGCSPGFHTCNGTCVDSKQVDHCGLACTACTTITGGESTCDGVKCGVRCPAGKKPCINACVDEGAACDGMCPAGKNPCNGICVDANSVSSCGTACVTCPTSPNGQTSCDGDKCVLKCNDGYHACGNTCASNTDPLTCGMGCTPCPIPAGGSATCDGTKCGATCPAKMKLCNGTCIDEGKACDGTCPTDTHNCAGNCVSNNDTANCGTSCMPCQAPANGQATCDGSKCNLKCNDGAFLCDGACRQCCNDGHCGSGKACKDGTCVTACPAGKDCRDGIAPCHAGKYICALTTSQPNCSDTGVDDSKGGCASGNHCQGGACVVNCTPGGSCGNDPCNPGTFQCVNGQRQCVTQPKTGGACGTNAKCEGNGIRAASSCQNGTCQPGGFTACPAPANATVTCNGTTCGFTCKDGYAKSGNGCMVACSSSQYLDGTACRDKKGTEGACQSAIECQSGNCLGEPNSLRCCPSGQVSCGGFCVDFEGPPTCNPTAGAKTFCEVFADSNNCTINALDDQCRIYQTKILTYYEYTIPRSSWLQKHSPKQKFYCCSSKQSANSATDPSCP